MQSFIHKACMGNASARHVGRVQSPPPPPPLPTTTPTAGLPSSATPDPSASLAVTATR